MLQALNIMEGFDGKTPLNSADYLHRQAEAMKLAYADRDTYYADPKFSQLNVQPLLTKEYAAERRKLIGPKHRWNFVPARSMARPDGIRRSRRWLPTRSTTY